MINQKRQSHSNSVMGIHSSTNHNSEISPQKMHHKTTASRGKHDPDITVSVKPPISHKTSEIFQKNPAKAKGSLASSHGASLSGFQSIQSKSAVVTKGTKDTVLSLADLTVQQP